MIQTDLSMQDLTKYFEANRLGELNFPNGFIRIGLRDLYKLIVGWKINKTEVPLDDIAGVIAFGSAVKFPSYEEKMTPRRKYLLFGPEIRKRKRFPIRPTDADFFVVTGNNLTREEFFPPLSLSDSDYGEGTWVKGWGIHLVNRGIEQVVRGVSESDTVSISAMKEGVPVFFDGRLSELQTRTGIQRENLRRISWDEDNRGYLIGQIE